MWKHTDKIRHKNNNQVSKHCRKKLPSKNTRIVFQSIKISKFSGVASFQTPLAARTLGAHVIRWLLKNIPILHSQKIGLSVCHCFYVCSFSCTVVAPFSFICLNNVF